MKELTPEICDDCKYFESFGKCIDPDEYIGLCMKNAGVNDLDGSGTRPIPVMMSEIINLTGSGPELPSWCPLDSEPNQE